MTTESVDPPASFVRRYRVPITFGALMLVAGLVATKLLMNYFGELPIVEPFKSFIEQLANASPDARSELQRYLAAHARDSVASEDFLPLCQTMLRQARAQGVNVTQMPVEILKLCN
jgi:hypothetical protein